MDYAQRVRDNETIREAAIKQYHMTQDDIDLVEEFRNHSCDDWSLDYPPVYKALAEYKEKLRHGNMSKVRETD